MFDHQQTNARPFPLLAAIAIYLVGFVVIARPWLSGAVTIPWDARAQFQPQLAFLARALHEGQSPFWTANVFAGWPQIADPQSLIFSPLHLLLATFDRAPSFRAADAVVFAALFLGGLGVILTFRERGWHVAGALVAALAFAFGGAAAARIQHIGEVLSLAYLPPALWLLARALDRSSRLFGALAGIAGGLIAAGRDQVALLSLYLLAGFVIAHWFAGPGLGARLRASARPLAAGAMAGAIVAMVPVVMTWLLAESSNRPGFDYVSAGRGSLHPAHLLTLAFADLYGAADPAVDYWGPPSLAWGPTGLFLAQNMGQLYLGAVPLVAILGLGLARGWLWSRDIRFFSIAALVAILYGVGWYTPVFRAIYEIVPGVTLFRRPADAAFLIGALLAVLGGYLVHRLLGDADRLTRPRWAVAICLGAAVIAGALGVAIAAGSLSVALAPILTGIGFAVAAVAVLAAARHLRHWPLAAAILVAAFTTADLAWNNAPNESTGLLPAVYDALRPDTANETIALLKAKLAATAAPDRRDRVELIGIAYPWPNISLIHGFDHVFGHNPLRLKAFAAATGVGDTVAVPEQRTFSPLFPSYRSPFADLFGLRFIATGVPVERIDTSLKPGDLTFIARTRDAYVYENPRALPRAMLVGEWRLADFAELIRSGWPDADPRRTVLLDRPPGPAPAAGAIGVFAGTARIARYDNAEVIVEVDAPSGAFLVLNDVWQSWWRADVDGAPVDILKANVLFRAVQVPPGRHVVRFAFHPFEGALDEVAHKFGLDR